MPSDIKDKIACEQALLFGQAERRSLARSRETRFTRPNRRACSQAKDKTVLKTIERRSVTSRYHGSKMFGSQKRELRQQRQRRQREWQKRAISLY